MRGKELVEELAQVGIEPHVAERVFIAIRKTLDRGGIVQIPDVGRLRSQKRRKWVPGSGRKKAVEDRIANLQYPATIVAGEPYEV